MKVLWFTHIAFKQDNNQQINYPGGNWVSSLLKLIEPELTLRLAFWGEKDLIFRNEIGTTFQQISVRKQNRFADIINRWQHKINDQSQIKKLIEVIDEFDPDLIQIFGTESSFGLISKHTTKPVIIHLQGIINPCLNAWMIPGLNNSVIIKNSKLSFFLRGVGLFHDYIRFKKMAARELIIFNNCNHFQGRTNWDKQMSQLFAPNSKYYHCDEVLRERFYNTVWQNLANEKFILSSTINSNIYKGLDVILKTAVILKKHTTLQFEWNIYGITAHDEYSKVVTDLIGADFISNNVNLKGIANEKQLIEGLKQSDLFVHCSYIDNSPNSVCEAQLIGLPVVSANVGGVNSIITHKETGYLVPPNEPHILASLIFELANNKTELEMISRNARLIAFKRHDKTKIKKELLDTYNSILNANSPNH